MFRVLALAAALLSVAAGAQTFESARDQRLVAFTDRQAARNSLASLKSDIELVEPVPPELERMFDRVDEAYRRVFPTLMAKKAKPALFASAGRSLTDSFTRTVQLVPGQSYFGLLVVPAGILGGAAGEASLAGTMAHQLAHLYLNQADPYRVLDAWYNNVFKTGLDTNTRGLIQAYVENARLIGSGSDLFEGFPLGGGMLQTAFKMMFQDLVHTPHPCSAEVARLKDDLQSKLQNSWSVFHGRYVFANSEDERVVRAKIRDLQTRTLACAKDASAGHDGFQRLFQIGSSLHDMMAKELGPKLQNVQWRSIEDEADEYAVLIMIQMALPPTDFSRQIVMEWDKKEPGLLETCDRAIRERRDVPFGDLGEPRHTPCYRLQQVTRFANRTFVR